MSSEFSDFVNLAATDLLNNNLKSAYRDIKKATRYTKQSIILDTKNGPVFGKYYPPTVGLTLTNEFDINNEIAS